MEQEHGTHKESKFESEDIISTMPDNVITNILNCLPLGDALGTAFLARNWRFKWTLLTKLVFDEEFSEYVKGRDGEYDWGIISRLLLHIKGPITKFFLYIPEGNVSDDKDIIHWVLFLSKKGMNEFTLINYMDEEKLKLPSHLLSCLELKHLELRNCCLYQVPSFCGFPNLLSLDLCKVTIEGGNCGDFITQCPLLEILKITCPVPTWKVKLVDILKLGNLIKLYLDCRYCEFLGEGGARKWGSTFFPCLKSLTLLPIDFSSDTMLSCVFEIIRGSPNLKTLKITAAVYRHGVPPSTFSFPEVDNDTMGQLQLRNVDFIMFKGSANEVFLIKYLLGSSPLLKKMLIRHYVVGHDNGKFARKLLKLRRASTIAEVDLY